MPVRFGSLAAFSTIELVKLCPDPRMESRWAPWSPSGAGPHLYDVMFPIVQPVVELVSALILSYQTLKNSRFVKVTLFHLTPVPESAG